jgi:hypothetical protein
MAIYPDLPGPRRRAMIRDLAHLALLALFVWLGVRVYHDVNQLSQLGDGLAATGGEVRGGFRDAAAAAGNVPLAGGALSDALRAAGSATGGSAAALGHRGASSAHHLAVLLGVLIWGIPTLLMAVFVLPRRVLEARRLHELRLAVQGPDAERRRGLLALRAALTLPEDVLFAHSDDPARDLREGRYDDLAAAAFDFSGLRFPRQPGQARR